MSKKILLITDLPSYGKMAMSAQIPLFSKMGFSVYNLPTALVSNNFGYGRYELLDTTDYIAGTIDVWQELDFYFDAICVGFVTSEKQVSLITRLIDFSRAKNPQLIVLVDPIMGDGGALYPGFGEKNVLSMRALCKIANIITPNFTEACFLADSFISLGELEKKQVSKDEAMHVAKTLHERSNADVVITSVPLKNQMAILAYQNGCFRKNETKKEFIFYEEFVTAFTGTGDFFSSLLLGGLLQNRSLLQACIWADEVIGLIIKKLANKSDKLDGVPIEELLNKTEL